RAESEGRRAGVSRVAGAEPGPSRRLSVGRCKTPPEPRWRNGRRLPRWHHGSAKDVLGLQRSTVPFSDQGAPVGRAWERAVGLGRPPPASKVSAVDPSVPVVPPPPPPLSRGEAFQPRLPPRRVVRRFTPTRAFCRLLWTPWRAVARRLPEGSLRE